MCLCACVCMGDIVFHCVWEIERKNQRKWLWEFLQEREKNVRGRARVRICLKEMDKVFVEFKKSNSSFYLAISSFYFFISPNFVLRSPILAHTTTSVPRKNPFYMAPRPRRRSSPPGRSSGFCANLSSNCACVPPFTEHQCEAGEKTMADEWPWVWRSLPDIMAIK